MMWTDGDGVLTVTREGMVMPFGPVDRDDAMARVLAGREIIGIIGERNVARAVQRAAGLEQAPATLDVDEPQFNLSLAALKVPKGRGELIRLADAPRDIMEDWRVAYEVEALGATGTMARVRGANALDDYIAADSHRVLVVDGAPVCMAGFNAVLPDIVQIGGVYVPPALRGRGFAGRAVALHLAQARAAGVRRATLFASGPAAVRAYRDIGFGPVGDWTLFLLSHNTEVPHG